MTAPIPAFVGQHPQSAPANPPPPHDGEAPERFRDALARNAQAQDRVPRKKQKQPDDTMPAPMGMQPVEHVSFSPLLPPVKEEKGRAEADASAPRGQGSVHAAAPAPDMPSGANSADIAGFASLLARLDAGAPASTMTQLTLPGDQWRADQVAIHQQGGALSVSVDLGDASDGRDEALKELEARLRARGLEARVHDDGGPD